MKLTLRNLLFVNVSLLLFLVATVNGYAQLCLDPANVIYGLTASGAIHPVAVSTGTAGSRINPSSGTSGSFANAMGYNNLNGRIYYFKRNINASPQQFVCYDPAANTITLLASCPSATIINLGCITADGLGYYCLDAQARLYYYRIATNSWTTISTNIRDQFGVTLASVITTNTRIMGDFAIDGAGNLWIVISGDIDYGLYKLNGALPTSAVASITIQRLLPPTTPTPSGISFGGIAFNNTGQIFLSTNSGDNRLYRMETNLLLTYLSTLSIDGLGNDLTSCNFPLALLPFSFKSFTADIKSKQNVLLTWSAFHEVGSEAYFIEHSSDGVRWETISSIQVRREQSDNEYKYTLPISSTGTHFYRIMTQQQSGAKYSDVRKVIVKDESVSVLSIWPNPSNDIINIQISSGKNIGQSVLTLMDNSGQTLKRFFVNEGRNLIKINDLKSGWYIIHIKYANGNSYNGKLVKL